MESQSVTDWKAPASAVPGYVPGALERYVNQGTDPGDFLIAVLRNDLRESLDRADEHSRTALFSIVEMLWKFAPRECWGSWETVKDWMLSGGLRGIAEMQGDGPP